jgi:predicted double-glycine peptidase
MVLAYLGVHRSQDQLAHQLGMYTELGVPASHITRLQTTSLNIAYGEGTLTDITGYLARDTPVIVFVQAGELNQWRGFRFQHAVVVVGLDEQTVYLLDPDLGPTPLSVPRDEFLLAWSEMDYLYAAIAFARPPSGRPGALPASTRPM